MPERLEFAIRREIDFWHTLEALQLELQRIKAERTPAPEAISTIRIHTERVTRMASIAEQALRATS